MTISSIADTAYQELKTMPVELQKQALDFIESLKVKASKPPSSGKLESTDTQPMINPTKRKLGFMANHGTVPDDINWGDEEIEAMFYEALTKEEVYDK